MYAGDKSRNLVDIGFSAPRFQYYREGRSELRQRLCADWRSGFLVEATNGILISIWNVIGSRNSGLKSLPGLCSKTIFPFENNLLCRLL
jgi:hypothetical protein